jgi:hypothetical protein
MGGRSAASVLQLGCFSGRVSPCTEKASDQCIELLRRHWSAQQVSLPHVTAELGQKLEIICG